MKNQFLNFIFIILIACVGGAVPVFGKISLTEIPTFSFTFIRFILALLVLLPFYLRVRQPINGDHWKIFGLSLLAMGNVLFFALGVQRTSAGIVQAIYTISPIMAACLSYFLLKEKFSFKKIIGILTGFMGALIIIFLPLIQQGLATGVTLLGNILIVIATTSLTLYTVYSKTFHKKYHPIEITTFFSVTTMGIMFFFSLTELSTGWWNNVSSSGALGLLYVGIFGTAFCYLGAQYIIKNTTPILASMIFNIQPFATILWAYLLLNETITGLFLFGITLGLVGVWITLNAKNKITVPQTSG